MNKLFRTTKTSLDTKLLQRDLDNISNWCDTNKLHLNVLKCKVITFSTKRPSLLNKYFLSVEVARVNHVKHFGIYLDCSLSFGGHYIYI